MTTVRMDGAHSVVGLENGALVCDGHGSVKMDWCKHIETVVAEGMEVEYLYKGQTLTVPIFPRMDVFVEVQLMQNDEFGQSALMRLNYAPDIGRPYHIDLGFWNPGEGMYSIREVIIDYLRSNLSPKEEWVKGPIRTKCPASVHGLKEAREMDMIRGSAKIMCLWNIVMEKACTPCMNLSNGDTNNFGVDDSVVANRGSRGSNYSPFQLVQSNWTWKPTASIPAASVSMRWLDA